MMAPLGNRPSTVLKECEGREGMYLARRYWEASKCEGEELERRNGAFGRGDGRPVRRNGFAAQCPREHEDVGIFYRVAHQYLKRRCNHVT